MAKANSFMAIAKRLGALQVKAENLRKEIKELSIFVMAESKKAAVPASAKKKTAKKAARKTGVKKAVKKPVKSESLTIFRKSPLRKASTKAKAKKR